MGQKDIKKMQNNKGITLVALVVTIIVLTILASISIGAVFSEKGIIQQAKDSKKQHEDALAAEERNLNDLLSDYNNSMGGSGSIGGGSGGGTTTPTPTPEPTPSVPTAPVIETATVNRTASEMSIDVTATDANNDSITYTLDWGTSNSYGKSKTASRKFG